MIFDNILMCLASNFEILRMGLRICAWNIISNFIFFFNILQHLCGSKINRLLDNLFHMKILKKKHWRKNKTFELLAQTTYYYFCFNNFGNVSYLMQYFDVFRICRYVLQVRLSRTDGLIFNLIQMFWNKKNWNLNEFRAKFWILDGILFRNENFLWDCFLQPGRLIEPRWRGYQFQCSTVLGAG